MLSPTKRVRSLTVLIWRRERDSNPRNGLTFARFPSVCLRPLNHLSMVINLFLELKFLGGNQFLTPSQLKI